MIGVGLSYGQVYAFHLCLVLYALISGGKLIGAVAYGQRGSKQYLPLVLLLIWYILSLAWAPDLSAALRYIGYWVIGITLVAATAYEVNTTSKLTLLLKVVAFCAAAELLVSLLEVFTSFRYPLSPFSPYAARVGRAYTLDFIGSAQSLATLETTPTGFSWNPNNLAATMSVVFPFGGLLSQRWMRLVFRTAVPIVVIATGSRASFLGLVLAVLLEIAIRSRTRAVLLAVTLGALWFGLPHIVVSPAIASGRLAEMADAVASARSLIAGSDFERNSIGIRRELMRNGLSALAESGGLGVGAGGSVAVQEQRGTVEGVTSMHNFWLEVLVEAGVLPALLLWTWYATLLWHSWKVATGPSPVRQVARCCTISLATFVISAASPSSTVYLLPMWLLMGIAIATTNIGKNARYGHA